jgi:hypothetical protein
VPASYSTFLWYYFRRLTSEPRHDAKELAWVLQSPEIRAFDEVQVLLNEPELVVSEAM